ncbi:MAG: chromosome segregation protein SMC [Desulfuromonadaceae bacterium]|nr:chromosome segregation protein SMC [Desulfuromonadaceae bacterium]
MKIRRLEIVGFKSFVDRTVFTFDPGISAVLGPNGCGKSNVVDAIRWVMGEQSAFNLRGQAMEDVIFAGSESRRPYGMAEVSLTFENSGTLEHPPITHPLVKDYAEIMLTRRLYRSGESEYLLNKTPCRLKDMTELFLDTGVGARAYSIIEQGKVATVLQSRPEERRSLIEEAAGISKYKVRRKAALRKIEAAQLNLQRVDDIITEVGERLQGLERQAKEAREFRELRGRLRHLDIGLRLKHCQNLSKKDDELTKREEQSNIEVERVDASLHQCSLGLERARLERDEAEKVLAQKRQHVHVWRDELQEYENNCSLARQQLDNHARYKEEAEKEKHQLEVQLAEDQKRLVALCQQRNAHEQITQQMRSEHERVHKELDDVVAAEQLLSGRVKSERKELNQAEIGRQRLGHRLDEVTREQAVLDERVARFLHENERVLSGLRTTQHEKEEQEQQQNEIATNVNAGELELEERRKQLHQNKAELNIAQRERDTAQQKYTQCASRLESLRELVENRADIGAATQQILQDAALSFGCTGVLADAIKVEPRYEAAVTAVLGERLESLYVRAGCEVETLALLRTHSERYLCQVEVAATQTDWGEEVPLAHRVSLPESLQGLFAGVYLVESIDPYLNTRLPAGTMLVTSEGEILSWQGLVVLGRKSGAGAHLLSNRRRIEELAQESLELQEDLEGKQKSLALWGAKCEQADSLYREQQLHCEQLRLLQSEAGRGLKKLEQRCVALEREHQQHVARQSQSEDKRTSVHRELILLHEEQEHLLRDITAAAEKVEESEKSWQQKRAEMQEKQRESATCSRDYTALAEQYKSLCKDNEYVERDIARQHERMEVLQQRQDEITIEVSALQKSEVQYAARIEVMLEKLRAGKKTAGLAQQQLDSRNANLRALEQKEHAQRSALYQVRQKLETVRLELHHNARELEQQQRQLEETYGIGVEQCAASLEELPTDAQAQLKRLQLRLESFGEVNLLAVEEYDALYERHTHLQEQQADLLQSIVDLRTAINQINRKSRSRFKKAFTLINEQFEKIFPRLFSGGNARLILTEPDDMLATGIDIEVRPPGKKLQNINLLSGGEKALTAVALIFAIFQVKPSPFCLLDEVDAPLDHANIGRFNAMIREMAATSQFVIITHNPRTMEIADTLYGVTMEEPGVSRLVSVDMSAYTASAGRA